MALLPSIIEVEEEVQYSGVLPGVRIAENIFQHSRA